jgi:hypothetical protein
MELGDDFKQVEPLEEPAPLPSSSTPMETEDDDFKPVEPIKEEPTSTPMTTEDIFKPDENDEQEDLSLSTPTPSTPMIIEDDVKSDENIEKKYNDVIGTKDELPEDVSKSINTVMDFVTSKIANKININIPSNVSESNIQNVQNGFNAVNEATEKMASSQIQNAGKRKKFRLTKKSRTQTK